MRNKTQSLSQIQQNQMSKQDTPIQEQPLISHLLELRKRVLWSTIIIIVLLVALIPFANDLYNFLAGPLLAALPENSTMIATEVTSTFFAPFKLAIFSAIAIAMPFLLHQAWSFISPGLYTNEKRFALPLLVTSSLLFYVGIAFAYFIVFPLLFAFFSSTSPDGVAMMTDINQYLSFAIKLFFAFGLVFEVPVATFLLIRTGFIERKRFAELRPYILVGCFVFSMLLTPPDPASQFLLAIPMYLLFEIGLLLSAITESKPQPNKE